jgi:hypothetical protein
MADDTRLWTSRGDRGVNVTTSQEIEEARFDEIHGEIISSRVRQQRHFARLLEAVARWE